MSGRPMLRVRCSSAGLKKANWMMEMTAVLKLAEMLS